MLRALGVPIVLGLVFSVLSLLVGTDVGARLRAFVPHRSHVVEPGESLSAIAAAYGLDGWRQVYEAGDNRRRHPDPDRIRAGARLDLPLRATLAPLPLVAARAPEWASAACRALSQAADPRSAWVMLVCRGSAPPDATGA
ncbi:MAG: LysM domain-containing protein [Myxococcota bacterium]|nr:LysM domain-containing protein [Myxococcota bacterium]